MSSHTKGQRNSSPTNEATAWAKAHRAGQTKARKTAEALELKVGDLVDVYRIPKGPMAKDLEGWRGPAKVLDCTPETLAEGKLWVRWQGRALAVRHQDLRRHVMYTALYESGSQPWNLITQVIHAIRNKVMTIGWIHTNHDGWQL